MSSVWGKDVIAIFCADIHLSLNPPIWRSVEPDWFAAMKRPLDEIKKLQKEFDCPVISAGDIFDRWNSPPELINFAYDNLPQMYSIPGQHDLPLHRYEDIRKSAYWTLVQADRIIDLSKDLINVSDSGITLYGFPYGKKITPIFHQSKMLQIAVVHEYRCIEGKAYIKAPGEFYLRMNEKNLIGYDVIVFGDNHKGFKVPVNTHSTIFNCGTLMKRKSDELDYQPQVGLLLKSGKVEPYYLDTSEDRYLEVQNITDTKTIFDMRAFIKELEKLGDTDLDFQDAMKRYLKRNKIKNGVCDIIRKAMGNE